MSFQLIGQYLTEFSSIGFEKPYNADYEGNHDLGVVSMISQNH